MEAPENRRIYIDGRPVIVVERNPPIPASLELLLEGGRDASKRLWTAMRVTARQPLRIRGTAGDCLAEDHRLAPWLEGIHLGSDGRSRHLRLMACQDCGCVCVRDISFDTLPGATPSRLAPRRRDNVIGWYSGARRGQRVHT